MNEKPAFGPAFLCVGSGRAVHEQALAVLLEPTALLFEIGADLPDKVPEPGAMVHLDPVAGLMDHDVGEDFGRREGEAPIEDR